MNYLEILLLVRQLTPVLRDLVGHFLKLIAQSPDPEGDVKRCVEELARARAFEELMRARSKKL